AIKVAGLLQKPAQLEPRRRCGAVSGHSGKGRDGVPVVPASLRRITARRADPSEDYVALRGAKRGTGRLRAGRGRDALGFVYFAVVQVHEREGGVAPRQVELARAVREIRPGLDQRLL